MKKLYKRNEDGFILNITVWISVLLLITALLTSTTARINSSTLKNNSDLLRSQEVAMGGFEIAKSLIADTDFLNRILRTEDTIKLKISGANVEIKFEDERGKIDLNTFPVEIVRNLFTSIGAESGVDAFRAAEIANKLSRIPTSGDTESTEKIRSVADLQFFSGVTLEFYKAIEPFVTVHGFGRKINPLTAPYTVLEHIPGATNTGLQKLVAARLSGKPRPSLDAAEIWLTSLSGPVYKIIIKVELQNKISDTLTALVVVNERNLGVSADAIKIIEIQ